MILNRTKEKWLLRLHQVLTSSSEAPSLTEKMLLQQVYEECPHNKDCKYHTLEHMLEVEERVSKRVMLSTELVAPLDRVAFPLAALFHDYGYTPGKPDTHNVRVACSVVEKFFAHIGNSYKLEAMGAHSMHSLVRRVCKIILATTYSSTKDVLDAGILAEADFASFNGTWEEFCKASSLIRQENKYVPRMQYLVKRREALISLCNILAPVPWAELRNAQKEIALLTKKIPVGKSRLLYAGTFDPMHKGHLSVIREAMSKGHSVVVAVMTNPTKAPPMFSAVERVIMAEDMIKTEGLRDKVYNDLPTGTIHHLTCQVVAADVNDTSVTATHFGCEGLLRGMRDVLDPSEYTRARALKAEAGLPTMLVKSTNRTRYYSSSAAKELIRGHYPCNIVTLNVRRMISEKMQQPKIVLLAGGICSGKTTLSETYKNDPSVTVLDMDHIAKIAMKDMGIVLTSDEIRNIHFRNKKRYLSFMSKIKPAVLSVLRGRLQIVDTDRIRTVVINVNVLGLLWGELVRMANGNLILMPEISVAEVESRTMSRGSDTSTTKCILALEKALRPKQGWEYWCQWNKHLNTVVQK